MVERVDELALTLADGREVPAATLVWCGGAKADPHAAGWGFTLDGSGRIPVSADSKAEGLDDVYVLGDVAAFRHPKDNRVLPMLAQFAITSAEHATRNILSEMDGEATAPFVPNQHGEFVSVGPSWGVGWMFGVSLSGVPAIFMKRLTYVLYWWQVGGLKLAWKRGRELLAMQR
jgi:NADH dehydrogenase